MRDPDDTEKMTAMVFDTIPAPPPPSDPFGLVMGLVGLAPIRLDLEDDDE